MEMLLDGRDLSALNLDERSAWSRFVMSLVRRNPEKVASITRVIDTHIEGRLARLEPKYANVQRPTDPATFEEYKTRRAPRHRQNSEGRSFDDHRRLASGWCSNKLNDFGRGDPPRSTVLLPNF